MTEKSPPPSPKNGWDKMTMSPIRYPGGKRWMAKTIIGLMPDHTSYVEVFGGGSSVLLNKPKSKIEVYNDINSDLVNFSRVAKYHLEPLLAELEFMVSSREIFNHYIRHPGETDIQRAAIWFYRNKNGYGGVDPNSFGRCRTGGGVAFSSRSAKMDKIRAMNSRLDGVCIENLPFEKIFMLYDTPDTLFFCDPPYAVNDETYRSADKFTESDHKRLAETVVAAKGCCILTLEATDTMKAIYNEIPVVSEMTRKCRISATSRQITEMILMKR